MAVDVITYGELTQPFRWVDNIDNTVLAAFPKARSLEEPTFFSTIAAVSTIGTERWNLLKASRRRFNITVDGVDFLTLADYAGQCPSALLTCTRWGLSAGRRVLLVKFETDYSKHEQRIVAWG